MKVRASFIAMIIMSLSACSSGSSTKTPVETEKDIYTQFIKGNYEKAAEIFYYGSADERILATASADEKRTAINAIAEHYEFEAKEKGGVKSYEFIQENILKEGQEITVVSKITFGNGSELTRNGRYINKDGRWKRGASDLM